MSINLFLTTPTLHPSLPLNRTKPLAFSFSLTSSSSNAPAQASALPNPNFAAAQYLVQSFGLSSDEALRASKSIQHLKSPDNPDKILRFLREIGISESAIRTAVSRYPRILCSHVDKICKPNIAKLQELGFSVEIISGIISSSPYAFRSNFGPKIDFWLDVLGSTENVYVVLTVQSGTLFSSSLENVIRPNLSFLKDQCGLSPHHIIRLIKSNPRLITCRPKILKMHAERVDELGVARSSGAFVKALIMVGYLNPDIIDSRLNNLRKLGLTQEEVEHIVSKSPLVLTASEEIVARKLEFLVKDAGCDMTHLVHNASLLTYSLENRLIPRNLVRKLLMSKGLPVANLKLVTFMQPREEEFVGKFVLPYEHAVPGLHRAYADADKIRGID